MRTLVTELQGVTVKTHKAFVLMGSNKNLTSDPMVDRRRVFLLRVNGKQAKPPCKGTA